MSSMDLSAPSFAVVGRPNKGKSSIVATLARDDSVHIAAAAGSTRHARRFPMEVNDEVLYELVDTPGIQRARAVLAWLQEHCADAAQRPATVRSFVESFQGTTQFTDECEALAAITAGAGIIYVVDGSCPFGADYEAEMEILRWTGQPSLALINLIENDAFVAQWTSGLGQYFQTVRTFDAHRAQHRKQLDLLELFGHLAPEWQQPLQRAVQVLEQDRYQQHASAAFKISELLVEGLTYTAEQRVPDGLPSATVQKMLYAQYQRHLKKSEQNCRRYVEELFYYTALQKTEAGMHFDEEDLFHQEHWYLWGLSKRQLIVAAASAGGIAGGGAGVVLDAATGGLSGGLGTLVSGIGGAVASARSAWKRSADIAQLKVSGIPTGGQRLSYGPSQNINFPFVLLGRAMQHHRSIALRTHAVRDTLHLGEPALDWLSDKERRSLAGLFSNVRKGNKSLEQRSVLEAMISQWCAAVDE